MDEAIIDTRFTWISVTAATNATTRIIRMMGEARRDSSRARDFSVRPAQSTQR